MSTSHANEKIDSWQYPGIWLWVVLFIGLAVRVYFVVFTEGTYDVGIWQDLAAGIQKYGLIGCYHTEGGMNHPPFISIVLSWLLGLAQTTGIPFRIFLRAPFALLDAGTALLLLHLFRSSRYRFVIMAAYWLYPLAMILSAYHGNTDSSVAFFLLLCVYLLSKEKIVWAGVALGVSLWIKLPAILAMPALLFFLPNWRHRLKFLFAVGFVGISTYLPVLFDDPGIVYKNVFGYRSQMVHTTAGIPVWGTQIFFERFNDLPDWLRAQLLRPVLFYLQNNVLFCIILVVLLSWLRRSKRTIRELGLTIAGIYAVLYGFSSLWSFQYFAWSIPFWFFAPLIFAVPAISLAGGYIYSLYWLVCGSPWLLGKWDFVGHPYWPNFIILLRNCALLFFFLAAWVFLIAGIYDETMRLYNRFRKPQPTALLPHSDIK